MTQRSHMTTHPATYQKLLRKFPTFSLERLLRTVFDPMPEEKLCILIDLDEPRDVTGFAFLNKKENSVQQKAYEVFYQELENGLKQKLELAACDFFAYKKTGGSNLELPKTAITPDGTLVNFEQDIYPVYDIILCISNFSATAPLTATAKRYGFRGATMHGVNDIILRTGLAVDYNEVHQFTEKLRQGMTRADSADVEFLFDGHLYHLHIDLDQQEAQKSHGICHKGPDIVNLPAGEVYFVPTNAKGNFPMQFEDGTFAIMHVENGSVTHAKFVKGNPNTVKEFQKKLESDPATGILGELGFGTQVLPFAGSDIQDEKIFGTFHLATGRNDHLNGNVTLDQFMNWSNATHEDILFSPHKTAEIHVKKVDLNRNGQSERLITDYEPGAYLWGLLNS